MKDDSRKILLLDDDEDYFILFRGLLKNSTLFSDYELHWGKNFEEARQMNQSAKYSAALVDLQLGGKKDGLDWIREVSTSAHSIPMILVTSQEDSSLDDRAIQAGASAYLVKGYLDQRSLQFSIRYAIESFRLTKELQESETKFRTLAETTPTATIVLESGKIQYSNPAFDTLTGYNSNEVKEMQVLDFVDCSQKEKVDVLLKQDAYQFESECRRKDHSTIYYIANGRKIEEQEKILDIVTFTDLTQIRQREEQLRKARSDAENAYSSLNGVMDASPAGILLIDHETKIEFCNPVAREMIGVDPNNQKRIFLSGYLDPHLKRQIEGAIRDYRRLGPIKGQMNSPRGKEIFVSLQMAPTQDESNQHFVCVLEDITHTRRMEKEFQQAAKMASIGELTSGIIHEWNQPLNVIILCLDSIRYSIQKGTVQEDFLEKQVTRAIAGFDRALGVVDNMKRFARKDAGNPSRIPVKLPIENTLEFLSDRIRMARAEIVFDSAPNLPCIMGNPPSLEQVYVNLIINALDILEDEPEEIERKIYVTFSREQDKIQTRISNTGKRIPKELEEKIFESFFTTKPEGEGTGLGLAVSRRIVAEHSGRLYVDSNAEMTTFVLELPVSPE